MNSLMKIAVIFSAILLVQCSTNRNDTSGDKADEPKMVLQFERNGGIAGFMDNLRIFDNFSYSCQQRNRAFNGWLSEGHKTQLLHILKRYGKITWGRKNAPDTADGMEESLYLRGTGKKKRLNNQDLTELLALAGTIIAQARR